MRDQLDIAMLYRTGASGRKERHSVDFVINSNSLFLATNAGQLDMCGCFSPDHLTSESERVRKENTRIAKIFTFDLPADIAPDRVAVFVCPECGDLGCGAITFQLSRDGDTVRWANFAYENGYDQPQSDEYSAIGSFEFAFRAYLGVIRRASSLAPMSVRP
jgi:hypothetical protein